MAAANEVVNGSKTDIKTVVSPLDLTALAGIGIKLNPNLEFNIRYHFGFIDIPNQGTFVSPFSFSNGLKNRYAAATIGYFFRGKEKSTN